MGGVSLWVNLPENSGQNRKYQKSTGKLILVILWTLVDWKQKETFEHIFFSWNLLSQQQHNYGSFQKWNKRVEYIILSYRKQMDRYWTSIWRHRIYPEDRGAVHTHLVSCTKSNDIWLVIFSKSKKTYNFTSRQPRDGLTELTWDWVDLGPSWLGPSRLGGPSWLIWDRPSWLMGRVCRGWVAGELRAQASWWQVDGK